MYEVVVKRHSDIFGIGTGSVNADPAGAHTQVTSAGQTVSATAANQVAFTGNKIAGLEIMDVAADLGDPSIANQDRLVVPCRRARAINDTNVRERDLLVADERLDLGAGIRIANRKSLVDEADAASANGLGLPTHVTNTVMKSLDDRTNLARAVLEFANMRYLLLPPHLGKFQSCHALPGA